MWNSKYPLQKISGFLCEVGRQIEFTLEDLVDGLFAVFTSEWRLQGEKSLHQTASPERNPQKSFD